MCRNKSCRVNRFGPCRCFILKVLSALRFDIEKAACAYVLGFGGQMEVIEPLALRDRVLQAAKETITLYT
ncbi:WCX domain-containing protein [Kovacikia minuta]|uniref:WYL domain-containing protein n=1 Tax=Kovacikia minuta TaxID=2931930 RepID=UPI0036F24897